MTTTLIHRLIERADRQGDQRAYTFLDQGETPGDILTYEVLERRARAVAAALRELVEPGDRALLMYPPGLEFVTAFFACLYADVIAVPAYPPHVSRPARCWPRLRAIATEAGIKAVLCPAAIAERLQELIASTPEFSQCSLLASDSVDTSAGQTWGPPNCARDSIAFLQFTSGSTAAPKGVVVTHGNIEHNLAYLARYTGGDSETVQVSWLPTYHDMGLFAGILYPLYLGCPSYLMSPVAFLQKPLRWLSAIHRFRGTNSGGPDFAYELCVERVPPESRGQLDLSSWKIAFNGAEPIRRSTLSRFWQSFRHQGFRWEAFRAAYGLAEATVFVSGGAVESSLDDRPVACGLPDCDTQLRIVDPETNHELPAGEVGEIWLRSPSVARGYWNRAEETEQTFSARLAESGEGAYLRTGDLGYLLHGELFVTGRLKDLVIVRGRKIYPQDIEQTVESSHGLIPANATAAIAVPTEQGERLVIVAEVQPIRIPRSTGSTFTPASTTTTTQKELQDVIGAIRQAVAEQHELQACGVALLSRGTIPKTSSGKIRRHECRHGFVTGTLDCVMEWTMPPLATRIDSSPHREPAHQ